jgi:hypothetical protein
LIFVLRIGVRAPGAQRGYGILLPALASKRKLLSFQAVRRPQAATGQDDIESCKVLSYHFHKGSGITQVLPDLPFRSPVHRVTSTISLTLNAARRIPIARGVS